MYTLVSVLSMQSNASSGACLIQLVAFVMPSDTCGPWQTGENNDILGACAAVLAKVAPSTWPKAAAKYMSEML